MIRFASVGTFTRGGKTLPGSYHEQRQGTFMKKINQKGSVKALESSSSRHQFNQVALWDGFEILELSAANRYSYLPRAADIVSEISDLVL